MESLPPLSAFTASLIGLIACAAIYLGAAGRGLMHRLAVASGVAVVLCISVLPYYLLKAFDNLGQESYELGFTLYLVVSASAALAALVSSLLLMWSRRQARPN